MKNVVHIQRLILTWYKENKRKLPWRDSRDPYKVFLSEVMLQQTQVDRVIPKYLAFIHAFPTIQRLASASRADVVRAWDGMGYNKRAVYLHEAAKELVARHHGKIPDTYAALCALPGVGRYTASAVLAFGYQQDVAVLDVNCRRVLHRIFFGNKASPTDKEALARRVMPIGKASDWHQALMDFGSAVCKQNAPRCALCPLKEVCKAFPVPKDTDQNAWKQKKEKFIGSRRFCRGKIVSYLRRQHATVAQLEKMLQKELPRNFFYKIQDLIAGLVADGLVKDDGKNICLS